MSDIWTEVLSHVENLVERRVYHEYFAQSALVSDNGALVVHVPSPHVGTWIAKHYRKEIKAALARVGRQGGKVRFVVGTVNRPTQPTPPVAPEEASNGGVPLVKRPNLQRLSDIRAEATKYLWKPRFAVGKVNLIIGDPGLGKSFIALDVAARVTAGKPWPDGSPGPEPGEVIALCGEDSYADTVRPRIDKLGGDAHFFRPLRTVGAGTRSRGIQLADIEALAIAIRESRPRMLIIDPISAYLGTVDSHRDSEVRGLLAPIAQLAEEHAIAVVGVMHLSKNTQRQAIYRASGSIAFTAAARIVHAVAPDDAVHGRRVFMTVKSNVSALPPSLAFTLKDGRLAWETEPIKSIDCESLLAGAEESRAERSDADRLLKVLLKDASQIDAKVMKEAGEAAVISPRTMRRAAVRLGLTPKRVGGAGADGRWVWVRSRATTKAMWTPPRRAPRSN
jgi:hypothetical protein